MKNEVKIKKILKEMGEGDVRKNKFTGALKVRLKDSLLYNKEEHINYIKQLKKLVGKKVWEYQNGKDVYLFVG